MLFTEQLAFLLVGRIRVFYLLSKNEKRSVHVVGHGDSGEISSTHKCTTPAFRLLHPQRGARTRRQSFAQTEQKREEAVGGWTI